MKKISTDVLKAAEKAHYDFQLGVFFTERTGRKNYTLLSNKYMKDRYWNYTALIDVPKTEVNKLILDVEGYYKQRDRRPAFYITPWTRPKNLGMLLGPSYQPSFTEAWMFYEGEGRKLSLPPEVSVERVDTFEEFQIFVDVFIRSYAEGPVYGSLGPGYIRSLLESWGKKKSHHFLAFYNDHPAGVGTLHFDGGFAELNDLGVLPEYRGKGIGVVLSNVRVVEAKKAGCSAIFLQTEAGSVLETWHNKRGLKTQFIARGFVKKD